MPSLSSQEDDKRRLIARKNKRSESYSSVDTKSAKKTKTKGSFKGAPSMAPDDLNASDEATPKVWGIDALGQYLKSEEANSGPYSVRVIISKGSKTNLDIRVVCSPTQTVVFEVSEDVIWVSSPVMREMLQLGAGQRNEPAHPYHKRFTEIHLKDSDPDALRNLLQIVHCKADPALVDASFDLVKRIARSSEKYQWQRAILPWKKIWADKYLERALEPGYEDWILIARVFGIEEEASKLLSILADECSSLFEDDKSKKKYFMRSGKQVYTENWPREADEILKIRGIRIRRLSMGLSRFKGYLESPDIDEFCDSNLCVNLCYGSMMRAINREGLAAVLEDYELWSGSVIELQEKMNRIRLDTYRSISEHHNCGIVAMKENFEERIRRTH
ncbi:hypothetical protein TWF730_008091 [Orbilia blumenaviensis]|uniref:BTB domain-containing protein n=1 Tax=Orbilia blumenaviensis TaxID=1796055 RepID=A0AAV9VBH5_9PEZI